MFKNEVNHKLKSDKPTSVRIIETSDFAESLEAVKAPKKTWRDLPDPIDETLISDMGKYDIVIVGGGTAGLFCARAAAMNGASVAVIENQMEDKFTHIGGEVGIVNSQYARDHGAPKIDEQEFLRQWTQRNIIRHNPKRASHFVKNSGRIFDWVIKDMSREWLAENTRVMSCPPRPNVITDVSGWKFYYGTVIFRRKTDGIGRWRWPELLKTHVKKTIENGVKWFFGHHAEMCDVDSSGSVTGVVAKRADGKYFRFKASRAVVLAAGDFGQNREMIIDILDLLRNQADAQGDRSLIRTSVNKVLARDGSGIKLGIWAGGHIEVGPRSYMGFGEPGVGVWHLQLDGNGERYCDEASGAVISMPTDSVTVTLHDSNWQKVLEMMPPRHGAPDTTHPIKWPKLLASFSDLKPGPIPKVMEGEPSIIKGTVYCANTIEELLDYTGCYKGIVREKAMEEIRRYNDLCEKGVDEDFGKDPRILKVTALKDPPFFARVQKNDVMGNFPGISPGLCATTGLDTDGDGHVLDSEFRPIKGLYAAGNNAGNRFITVYQSPLSGISLGMAMTEGFMLGERLATIK